MPKKKCANASLCHEHLRRLASDYKEHEQRLRDAGKDRLADIEHENYEAMIRAMTVIVRTRSI